LFFNPELIIKGSWIHFIAAIYKFHYDSFPLSDILFPQTSFSIPAFIYFKTEDRESRKLTSAWDMSTIKAVNWIQINQRRTWNQGHGNLLTQDGFSPLSHHNASCHF